MKERGFTLVEMLVALALFAAIASMGVGLLRTSVATQDAVQQRLGSMGAINRLRAAMANDLAQAALRPIRDENGGALPAFVGRGDGFTMVHRTLPESTGGAAVQRAGYALANGAWMRSTADGDGATMGEGDALLRDIASARLRYRDAAGIWRDSWSSAEERRLPVAVELSLTRRSGQPLTLLFATAPTLLPPPLLPPPPGPPA